MEEVLKHYNLLDKCKCYFNLKNAFLNTVQNRYLAFNYTQLSSFDNNCITNNIKFLYDNLEDVEVDKCNETEQRIDEILKNGGLMDVIEYVGTLTDEVILNDIPDMPHFIVKYLNSDDDKRKKLKADIRCYNDIKNK